MNWYTLLVFGLAYFLVFLIDICILTIKTYEKIKESQYFLVEIYNKFFLNFLKQKKIWFLSQIFFFF